MAKFINNLDGKFCTSDGSQYWFKDNNLHREDGPAVIHDDGTQEWWLNGHLITDDNFILFCLRGHTVDNDV